MKKQPSKILIHSLVTGAGLLLAATLIAVVWFSINYLRPAPSEGPPSQAVQTIIPAPTATPVVVMPTLNASTPTSTPQVLIPPSNDAVQIGTYVQITGTGGVGLRLREEPGTDRPPRFLGMEGEVFEVRDGPRQADGLVWWLLTAPYDTTRSGWAVSNYLVTIQSP